MNMKNILRLMGAITLTTVTATSVVACGNGGETPTNRYLNGKYAGFIRMI